MSKIKAPDWRKRPALGSQVAGHTLTKFEEGWTAASLPRDLRITLARMTAPWFDPPHTPVADEQYSEAWWNGLNANQRTIIWQLMFPERCVRGFKDTPKEHKPVEFYAKVKESNALGWYAGLPEHRKKQVDAELAKIIPPESAMPGSALYQATAEEWGTRPELPDIAPAGLDRDGMLRVEVFRDWCRYYNDLATVQTIVRLAPSMQEESRALNKAMGIEAAGKDLPTQADGLESVQAATVRWLQSSGKTPLEYLAEVYRSDDPEIPVQHKISAAKALMEYTHRKIPPKVAPTDTQQTITLDKGALSSLSEEELHLMEKLLTKMSGAVE